MFEDDPLVARMVRLLGEERTGADAEEELDWLIAMLCIVAAEHKWRYLMQVCLPRLATMPEAMREEIGDIDDEHLVQLLAFGQRINEAIYLRLHGRAAMIERLNAVRLPARLWNVPWTDRWVSTDTVRVMLADIREQAHRLASRKRAAWIAKTLRTRCTALNKRMLDAADFTLIRHMMATGRQWVRLTKASEQEAIHVRIHYASGILSVALRSAGIARTKRTILPLLVGKLLSDEERPHIDRHFALSFLSMRVLDTLWHLRERSPLGVLLPFLQSFYALLFADLFADPAIAARIAALGEHPTLVVTAHGTLAQLPMVALHDGDRYLAQRFNVVQAAPLFAEGAFEIGDIDYEALVGGERVKTPTLRVLAGGEGLHQIVHEIDDLLGLARDGPLTVEIGPRDGEAPWTADTLRWLFDAEGAALISAHMRSSVSDAALAVVITPDGREIAIGDVLGRSIRARLVMLSGCLSSGYTDWLAPGENSVVSLVRRAGADTVISTLWPVRDYPTRLYNVAFLRAWASGASRVAAHGMAQRAVMAASATIGQMEGGERLARRRTGDTSAPEPIQPLDHPNYWAGFILTGAWR